MESKKPRIVRTEKEINEVLEDAIEKSEHGLAPQYYDGIIDMYDWLTGAKEIKI